MTGKPQSVLYVLPAQLPISYPAVGAMQQIALGKHLPFAVVYQLRERTEEIDAQLRLLHEAESHLAQLDIPLILLLGPSEPILKSLIHHSRADMYTEPAAALSRIPTQHPHKWPGMVRSIDELQPVIDQMTSSETRTFC